MKLKPSILTVANTATLRQIVDDYELSVEDKRKRQALVDGISSARRCRPEVLLGYLGEAAVKQVCEALGVEARGRKNALIARLLEAAAPAPPQPPLKNSPPRTFSQLTTRKPMSDKQPTQESLQLVRPDGGSTNVEKYEFEPIKGYPMLNWRGKRPFTSTQYYPAQLKEVHGNEVDGWRNKIFWGDNLQVMGHLLKQFRGQVDLIYIDPPFDSNVQYKKEIRVSKGSIYSDSGVFEEKQYSDIWNNDEYLQFMYERVVMLRELLSPSGVIFLHCDWHANSHLRLILEEIMGKANFLNEIVWKRRGGTTSPDARVLPRITDTILVFGKSDEFEFNPIYIRDDDDPYVGRFNRDDGDGRKYNLIPLNASQPRPNLMYEYKGHKAPRFGWSVSLDRMKELDAKGLLYFPLDPTQRIYKKSFLDEWQGQPLTSLWTDIKLVNPMAEERTNYPTQKPLALLERIVALASKPGGMIPPRKTGH